MTLERPQQIFRHFNLATFAPAGTTLSPPVEGYPGLKQPDRPYGVVTEAAIGVADGRILWIMPTADIPNSPGAEIIDGSGRWLTPGLIDCHTHLVHAGRRADEWEQRLAGLPYEQIARQGGGILSTVRATRQASESDLMRFSLPRLQALMAEGVTTIEIKSGYGLDLQTELKMLNVARRLGEVANVRIEPTLLAAHAVPPEYADRAGDYIEHVCQEILPAAAESCTAVDAFCESIAFDVDQTVRVFEAARQHGLRFKVHAEQLTHTGIAAVAAEMGALSADHLECLAPDDCPALARNSTVATLLPGAFYFLRETRVPPIDALRQSQVSLAVATDCNPGSSPLTSIRLAANMACTLFGLSVEESLAAITVHAAHALGLNGVVGSLQPGHQADFAVWDVASPAEIIYEIGRNPCTGVYQAGQLRPTLVAS